MEDTERVEQSTDLITSPLETTPPVCLIPSRRDHYLGRWGGPLSLAVPIGFVITAPMDSIRDRFGTEYTVTRSPLQADGTVIYYAHAGDEFIARAVVQVFKGCISDVLVYKDSNRRKGIGTALYALIEAELGRPLVPSRIRSKAGRAFWSSRR